MSERNSTARTGMSARQASIVEWSIIGLCVVALVLVFQPFSLSLYSVGAGLVVFAGLAFNLVPLCRPGVSAKSLIKAGLIVLILLLVVAALAIASAYLYGIYLKSQQG